MKSASDDADGDDPDRTLERLRLLVWSTIDQYELSEGEREDVFGATMNRLIEILPSIGDPFRLPGWIVSATRKEAQRLGPER